MTRRCWAVAVLVAAMLATAACGSDSSGGGTSATATPSGQMILATTTSTRDTGLLDTLVPAFEKASKCSVKTVAVGSGQAIDLGARGQADVAAGALPRRRADVHGRRATASAAWPSCTTTSCSSVRRPIPAKAAGAGGIEPALQAIAQHEVAVRLARR